jgi:hypothetical protein
MRYSEFQDPDPKNFGNRFRIRTHEYGSATLVFCTDPLLTTVTYYSTN